MNYINTYFFTELAVQENETKLNKLANICFSPLHYWKGRTVQCSRVSVSSFTRFHLGTRNYLPRLILDELRQENSKTWIKTLLAVALFVPAILVGSVFKSLSLVEKQTREMFCRASSQDLSQHFDKSTIYLPPKWSFRRSEYYPCEYRFIFSEPFDHANSDNSISVEKINRKDRSFGVVIHRNGLTSEDQKPFYTIQLTNPTESEPQRSIWGRVTYPINHNFTCADPILLEEPESISFKEKSSNKKTNPMRVIKVFATHTNSSMMTWFYVTISQAPDWRLGDWPALDLRDQDCPESDY